MKKFHALSFSGWLWIAAFLAITTAVYWPGLSGGFIFDDYANIVENPGIRMDTLAIADLAKAALSSPSSEFKRPIASLSFALNYYWTQLDPYWMKLTNLILHLLNGLLFYLLGLFLLRRAFGRSAGLVAAWTAGAWLLLPINLTAVLYVVQRMESLANLFVLLGLIGYLQGRRLMDLRPRSGAILACGSLVGALVFGLLCKETAVLLPAYAIAIEFFCLGGFAKGNPHRRVLTVLYGALLLAPLVVGSIWLAPRVLDPAAWAGRDFTLQERLLSETRIVLQYIAWTLTPTMDALSFYHDEFQVSRGLFTPWSTLPSLLLVMLLVLTPFLIRKRLPVVALGLALYFLGHSLTATVLPLELIFEHRNYFSSYGLLLALFSLLSGALRPSDAAGGARKSDLRRSLLLPGLATTAWAAITALTASAWQNSLRLSIELAARAPESPRAQYELGKTYVVYSGYKADSPLVPLAYETLETASALNKANILPEQALVYLAANLGQPTKDEWWTRMEEKLERNKTSVESDSALMSLARCARDGKCDLPQDRMIQLFLTELSKPNASSRVLAAYGDYAWNVLKDRALGETATRDAVARAPQEPTYLITLVRMLLAQGKFDEAPPYMEQLKGLNRLHRLDRDLLGLQRILDCSEGRRCDAQIR